MELIYFTGLQLIRAAYRIAAFVSVKARKLHEGHQEQRRRLQETFPIAGNSPVVWFHCASLGEFEQGRPVIEAIRAWRGDIKILLTFFSPSGFEVRKNYEHADFIFYLPWDSPANAKWFVQNVKPSLVVFIKYEFWYFYSRAIREKGIPLLSVSSIFRPGQAFFRSAGSFFKRILLNFDHFFVQNAESVALLNSIGIQSVTLTGDTRFDRVHQIARDSKELELVREFKSDSPLMVIGSAWQEDMNLLIPFINTHSSKMKFIVAPHEIGEPFMREMELAIQPEVTRYSNRGKDSRANVRVLMVDNIGLLASLYRYADFAYVGGGFGDGLHNILEPACFGVPVFFGNKNYEKFQEANDLMADGVAFGVADVDGLTSAFENLTADPSKYQNARMAALRYVEEHRGATDKVVEYCKKILA